MQARVAAGQGDWGQLYDEPVHPNQRGHDAIAAALFEVFTAALAAPSGTAPPSPSPCMGVTTSSPAPGLATSSSLTSIAASRAAARCTLSGRTSKRAGSRARTTRPLPSWSGAGRLPSSRRERALPQPRSLGGRRPRRDPARPGARAPWLPRLVPHPGGPATWSPALTCCMCASSATNNRAADGLKHARRDGGGAAGVELQHFDFERKGWRRRPHRHRRARAAVHRPHGAQARRRQAAVRLSWSGNSCARASRVSRSRSASSRTASATTVWIDQQPHRLHLRGERGEWVLSKTLPPGARAAPRQAHRGLAGRRHVARPAPLAWWPPAAAAARARPLRLVVYGDSITAGACNGDLGADQYEDLSTRRHPCLARSRPSGWAPTTLARPSAASASRPPGDMLQHQVWDRVAPRLDAPIAPPDPVKPEIVVINLGRTTTASRIRWVSLSPEFGALPRLPPPGAPAPPWRPLVIAVGGMTAWKDEPRLAKALTTPANPAPKAIRLVWRYNFQAFCLRAPAHRRPRPDG